MLPEKIGEEVCLCSLPLSTLAAALSPSAASPLLSCRPPHNLCSRRPLSAAALATCSLTAPLQVAVHSLTMESPENQEETATHRTEKLAGTVNWGTATVVGIFAGLLYGGSKEAYASVSKDAEVMLKLGSTPDKREQHRLMRDAMEKRFVRVTRGSLIGGVRLGMFTAAFYGLQNFLAENRGVIDVYNVVGAGSATASTFGLILPGSFRWRLRNAMLGSVLGAAICFPIGWLHLKLVEKANGGKLYTTTEEAKSGIASAVENLEGKLSKRA